jgi:hypothetical protein
VTALPGNRCPGCGSELRLTLDARGAGGSDWATGVLAAALGAALFLLTAPDVIRDVVRGGFGNARFDGMGIWIAGFVLTVGTLAWWLLGRRRIRRWRRGRIRLAAAGTLLLALGLIGWLAAVG